MKIEIKNLRFWKQKERKLQQFYVQKLKKKK